MKKTVHIISHSHWDREWYMSFEQHRMYLVTLMDEVLRLFEEDPEFKSFHLDGQMIVLDDYLEIRPQNKEKVKQAIASGRLIVGPWYILQDEFLTSSEANVRNLLAGMERMREYSEDPEIKICKTGYFPDAFGNAGQMPQILKQAGMEAIAFGRGVKPVGFNNQMEEHGKYDSAFSEMNWESPDGSGLLGILFANWYCNGNEIPTDPAEAKKYWDERLKEAEQFAGTSHLLFMNGCDHQPVQKDLSKAIETARKIYPDITFVHSDFNTYVEAVKAEASERMTTIKGELTSQETDGHWTLVNTTSAHVDLKKQNYICETALERTAEPLSVMSYLNGGTYEEDFLHYSWKMLMQNHPHDSICCCSVDEVTAEMKTRFDKSRQVAEAVSEKAKSYLAERIWAPELESKEQIAAFAIWNTSGREKREYIEVTLDWARSWDLNQIQAWQEMEQKDFPQMEVIDADGNIVDASIQNLGTVFGYTLPEDRFRQPYMARQIRVGMEAVVPAVGYTTYFVRSAEQKKKNAESKSMFLSETEMENGKMRVEVAPDGSYCITDKTTGHRFENLGWFEESGDIGNEYIYIEPHSGERYTTKGGKARIAILEDTQNRAVIQLSQTMEVPMSADALLKIEQCSMKNIFAREAGRAKEKTTICLETRLILEKQAAGLKVETVVHNTAKDHRIRVVFPSGMKTEEHFADSVFEVVTRSNRHSKAWTNPSGCEHQQGFAGICDKEAGLLIANRGLYEYELLPDCENAIAVTLCRSVGEMGDWGVFPCESAQMIGSYVMEYEIIPFAGTEKEKAIQLAYQYRNPLQSCQLPTGCCREYASETHAEQMRCCPQERILPKTRSYLTWNGKGLILTGVKKQDKGKAVILRWMNVTDQQITLKLDKTDWMENVYLSNVMEQTESELLEKEGRYEKITAPGEIVTLAVYPYLNKKELEKHYE